MAYKILRDFTVFNREYMAVRDGTLTPLDIEGWGVSKEIAEAKLSELVIRGWIEPAQPVLVIGRAPYETLEPTSPEEQLPGI